MADFNLAFYRTDQWIIVAGSFVMLFGAGEIGWRIARARQLDDDELRGLVGGVAAATLGLLGLLLGFALSMAIGRFDARRQVIVTEANAIGTLWLRAGLLEEPLRDELRRVLRDYTEARVALHEGSRNQPTLLEAKARSERIHRDIWSVVERAAKPNSHPAVLSTLITSANEVIDLHELRFSSVENYVPAPVILLLVGVGAIALSFLGWSFGAAKRRATVAMGLLTLLLCAVLTVIIDLNRPHRGVIQVGQQSILRLRESIAEPGSR